MDFSILEDCKEWTLLYLEDNEKVRESLFLTLREMFKAVHVCTCVNDAMRSYREYLPDILLLDIHMVEGKSGLEMVEEIREKDRETPIIIASAYGTYEHLKRSIPLQLVDFLIKPFTLDDLLNAFEKAGKKVHTNKKSRRGSLIEFPGGMRYDSVNHFLLDQEDRRHDLHYREWMLLELFINNRSRPLSHEEINQGIWNGEEISDVTLRTLVNKLRKKIGKDAILTLTGYGYRLEVVSG